MKGLILFAHGARDPRWSAPFEAVAARVRARQPGLALRLAFLELMAPSLPDAANELIAAGCTDIVVLPLFLGTGGHLRQDLPRLMQALTDRHPTLRFTLEPAAGETDAVIDAMASVALAAVTQPEGYR